MGSLLLFFNVILFYLFNWFKQSTQFLNITIKKANLRDIHKKTLILLYNNEENRF